MYRYGVDLFSRKQASALLKQTFNNRFLFAAARIHNLIIVFIPPLVSFYYSRKLANRPADITTDISKLPI